ncbi:hypothetical protein AB0C69_10950 [Actinomadura sp. NPDC048032]|uniref:hypothetical protein n=1 Tax=Actinomadura sp. NPDC048032 TaxID=3155747 RepID=UPI0033C798B4
MTETITVPRQIFLEMLRTACAVERPQKHDVISALIDIAQATDHQSNRAARWTVPAAPTWVAAYSADAHTVYGHDIGDDHPAVIAQNAIRDALRRDAPGTCRAMQKQWGVSELVTCGHCRGPWSLTHSCAGQPEPVLTNDHE